MTEKQMMDIHALRQADEEFLDVAKAGGFGPPPGEWDAERGASREPKGSRAVWTEERRSAATERRGKTARRGGPKTSGK
jgi:hypothetical protein